MTCSCYCLWLVLWVPGTSEKCCCQSTSSWVNNSRFLGEGRGQEPGGRQWEINVKHTHYLLAPQVSLSVWPHVDGHWSSCTWKSPKTWNAAKWPETQPNPACFHETGCQYSLSFLAFPSIFSAYYLIKINRFLINYSDSDVVCQNFIILLSELQHAIIYLSFCCSHFDGIGWRNLFLGA